MAPDFDLIFYYCRLLSRLLLAGGIESSSDRVDIEPWRRFIPSEPYDDGVSVLVIK